MDRFRVRAKLKRMRKWAKAFNGKMDEVERAKEKARKDAFKDAFSFVDALRGKGFEPLGSGYFSSVLGHPASDKVVKIIYTPERDGWLDYVKWAADKGYAGKFAPKVFSYKLIKGRKEDFGVAVMERLKATVADTPPTDDAKAIAHLFIPAMNSNPLATKLLDSVNPGLAQFGKDLKVQFPKSLDTHLGNMMVRKDGTFVVSDPVASIESKLAKLRLRLRDFSIPTLPKLAA